MTAQIQPPPDSQATDAELAAALIGKVSSTDPRLSDPRVPVAGSVTDASIAAPGLEISSVDGLAAELGALNSRITAIGGVNGDDLGATFDAPVLASSGAIVIDNIKTHFRLTADGHAYYNTDPTAIPQAEQAFLKFPEMKLQTIGG